jgi:hypothetical protein
MIAQVTIINTSWNKTEFSQPISSTIVYEYIILTISMVEFSRLTLPAIFFLAHRCPAGAINTQKNSREQKKTSHPSFVYLCIRLRAKKSQPKIEFLTETRGFKVGNYGNFNRPRQNNILIW